MARNQNARHKDGLPQAFRARLSCQVILCYVYCDPKNILYYAVRHFSIFFHFLGNVVGEDGEPCTAKEERWDIMHSSNSRSIYVSTLAQLRFTLFSIEEATYLQTPTTSIISHHESFDIASGLYTHSGGIRGCHQARTTGSLHQ